MDVIQAVVLGIVQGLTEFLPVSSSGHLVLGQRLFGLDEPDLLFDISVHVGTLAAVLVFFRRDLAALLAAAWRLAALLPTPRAIGKAVAADPHMRLGLLIVLGSVPTAVIGLALNEIADQLFGSVRLVGGALLVTGALLASTRLNQPPERNGRSLTAGRALVVGLAQGLAIVPGISRSGTTIAVAMRLGVGREEAARFSFLLSIPAIFGAALLGARDLTGLPPEALGVILAGMAASALVGYFALWMLVYLVRRGNLYLFAPYCIAVGLVALGLA